MYTTRNQAHEQLTSWRFRPDFFASSMHRLKEPTPRTQHCKVLRHAAYEPEQIYVLRSHRSLQLAKTRPAQRKKKIRPRCFSSHLPARQIINENPAETAHLRRACHACSSRLRKASLAPENPSVQSFERRNSSDSSPAISASVTSALLAAVIAARSLQLGDSLAQLVGRRSYLPGAHHVSKRAESHFRRA